MWTKTDKGWKTDLINLWTHHGYLSLPTGKTFDSVESFRKKCKSLGEDRWGYVDSKGREFMVVV